MLRKELKDYGTTSAARPDGLILLLPVFQHFRIRLRDLQRVWEAAFSPAIDAVTHFPYYGAPGTTPFALRRQ